MNQLLIKDKVTIKNITLTYYKAGSGQHLLFCFHGYGQSGRDFVFLQNHIGSSYTIIGINWFFTDESYCAEPMKIDTEILRQFIENICMKESLSRKISLCSFSIGVIPLFALLSKKSEIFNKIIIIAAPGFAFFRLVNFGVNTLIGSWIFERVIKNQKWFYLFVNSFVGKFILGKSKIKLLNNFIETSEKLLTVRKVWQTLQGLLISKKQLTALKLPNSFYLVGSFDKVTPAFLLNEILIKVGSMYIKTQSGHKLNTADNIKNIKQILLNA
ncbi:MAG: hypothetical protein ACK4K9_06565 [Bacteroidia bacterium]